MTYEQIIQQAEAKCDEWFVRNPDYFYDKARQIAERRKAWEKEYEGLNPTDRKTVWLSDNTNPKEKVEVTIPVLKNPNQIRIEPSIIDPIFACVGKCTLHERKTVVTIPQDKEDTLLIYAACLLILHDGAALNGAGYQVITKDIWPDTWPQQWARWAVKFFDPKGNDRSAFIGAALRHVEADFAGEQGIGRQGKLPSGGAANGQRWEAPWDETDNSYMESGKARVDYTDNKMSAANLSKKLGKIPVHFMRKPGKGARVHIGEFRTWAKKEYADAVSIFESEAAQEYLADIEAKKATERAKRRQE